MAESTLSPTQAERSREIAFYLQYRRLASTAEGLTAAQAANVDVARESGEARFAIAHDWGCLRPRLSFTLWADVAGTVSATHVAGTSTVTATSALFYASMIGHSIVIATVGTFTITGYTSTTVISVSGNATCTAKAFTITADGIYRLPDDFGGMESTEIEFARDEGHFKFISVVNEELVVKKWQYNDTVNRPEIAAPRVLASDGTGQRWDLVVAPIPDENYTVSFRYNSIPNALTSGQYGPGGALLADALLKCCLAAAEEKFNENQTAMRLQESAALQKAIRFDLKYYRARKLGRTTTSNFRSVDESMNSRATGFVYRGTTYDVE